MVYGVIKDAYGRGLETWDRTSAAQTGSCVGFIDILIALDDSVIALDETNRTKGRDVCWCPKMNTTTPIKTLNLFTFLYLSRTLIVLLQELVVVRREGDRFCRHHHRGSPKCDTIWMRSRLSS